MPLRASADKSVWIRSDAFLSGFDTNIGPTGTADVDPRIDLDNDLKAEIYVANDMAPNFLFTQSKSSAASIGRPSANAW